MRKHSETLEEKIKEIKDYKIEKIERDELIKTLMNFSVLSLILTLLPLMDNIQVGYIVLPTIFAFSPTLSLIYFIFILILYKYYKRVKK